MSTTSLRMRQPKIEYKWLVTIAVVLGAFMSALDQTVVNVAIPRMQHAFGANIQSVQWVVTVYMLTQAAVIPSASFLVNRFGSKRAYVWTLAAFTLGSLLCGIAWNLPTLIIARIIQGIGGGILLPLVSTLLYQTFPPQERGTAISIMSIPLMIAPAVGPIFGGYLVTYMGWEWAFLINIPVGIIAVLLSQKILRHTSSDSSIKLDLPGFLLAAYGSAALIYGISEGANAGWRSFSILFLAFSGAIALVAFVVTELVKVRQQRNPLLDLRLFKHRTFTVSVIALVCVSSALFGILFLLPIYLQTLRGQSAVQAGMTMLAESFAMMVALIIGGRLTDRIGPRPVVIGGLTLLIGACAFMSAFTLSTPLWLVLLGLVLLGLAFGFSQPLTVAAMSSTRGPKEIANGSTLTTVMRSFAAPVGVATLSTIVQTQTFAHVSVLSARQHLTGILLQNQSTMLAMRDGFLAALVIGVLGLIATLFIKNPRPKADAVPEEVGIETAEELAQA